MSSIDKSTNTCRLCPATLASLPQDQVVRCFEESAEGCVESARVANVLGKHCWFELCPNKDASAFVCKPCWNQVNSYNRFYQSALKAKETTTRNESSQTMAMPNALFRSDRHFFLVKSGNDAKHIGALSLGFTSPVIVLCGTDKKVLQMKPDIEYYYERKLLFLVDGFSLEKRCEIKAQFMDGSSELLITTASQLLELGLTHTFRTLLINYDLPSTAEEYASGYASCAWYYRTIILNFIGDGDKSLLVDIERMYNIKMIKGFNDIYNLH